MIDLVILCQSEFSVRSILGQFLVVFLSFYFRLRGQVLTVSSLLSAGIPLEREPLTWATAISGLNTILTKKIDPMRITQTLLFNGITLGTRHSACQILIKNRLPERNKVAFPFSFSPPGTFPFSGPGSHRNVSTASAAKKVLKFVTGALNQYPNGAIAGSAAVLGGGYFVYENERRFQIQKQQFEQQKEQFEQQTQIQKEQFQFQKERFYQKMDFKRKTIGLEEIESGERKLALREKLSVNGNVVSKEVESGQNKRENLTAGIEVIPLEKVSSGSISVDGKPPMIPSAKEETSSFLLQLWHFFSG